jgi:hypothetical protein
MNWLRTNYDRAAAMAAVLFLIVCSLFVFLNSSGFGERYSALQNLPAPNNKIPPAGRPRSPRQWKT